MTFMRRLMYLSFHAQPRLCIVVSTERDIIDDLVYSVLKVLPESGSARLFAKREVS